MEVKAKSRYLRISPKKANAVIRLIRNKTPKEALDILYNTNKKASLYIIKTLKSALANAKNNFNLNEENLYISQAKVDKGPVLKRLNPRSRGRADILRKPTSHITIILSERVEQIKNQRTKEKNIKKTKKESLKGEK